MTWFRNRRYLLPIALGLLGLLLLLRVLAVSGSVLIPEDVDVIILVILLGLVMLVALQVLIGLWMDHLRRTSEQHARRETLAEHVRFLSRLDHELKNPLTALRAGLGTLVLTGLDEQQQALVEAMKTETLRLSSLVADLRKLAELEAQPLELRAVEIEPFATGIIDAERERFENAGRLLSSRVEVGRQTWTFDEDLVSLAVHNLLDNALKYTPAAGAVHLDMSVDDALTITVSDTGPGIPAEALPHVWEELYRSRPLAEVPGSGIGLALVKAIVERHEGSVSIESRKGRGTSVTMRLPAERLTT